jgi:bleomycin hydrolase
MKKTVLTVCLFAAVAFPAMAQNSGGITKQMLAEIEKSQKPTAADRAIGNAIAANAIDNLAKNHANAGLLDTHFSIETPKQSISDQQSSGRCWMFSGFNVLRSDFAQRTDSLTVEFSQAYLFFYDQLEKANLFLQGVIDTGKKPMDDARVQFFFKNPINDGGTFCGVADLTEKYGLVPKSVMPESYSSDNTSRMAALLKSKLREQGLELREMVAKGKKTADILAAKTRMLSTIYHMLVLTIGQPPQQFSYAFCNKEGKLVGPAKSYTPMSFYKETVGEALNGTFIMVMNDPRRAYHKTYEVEWDRHTYDGHNWRYLNLPMDEIAQLAIAQLRDGRKMYSSYDVGKCLDRKRGYCDTENFDYASLFSTTFGMNKAQRISTFDSGSTHAMTLTAVDLDELGKPVKWKVENSWGASWGENGGCLIMSNRWFEEYMFRLVVDMRYVPEQLKREYEQKPVMVMPEDPLFAADE